MQPWQAEDTSFKIYKKSYIPKCHSESKQSLTPHLCVRHVSYLILTSLWRRSSQYPSPSYHQHRRSWCHYCRQAAGLLLYWQQKKYRVPGRAHESQGRVGSAIIQMRGDCRWAAVSAPHVGLCLLDGASCMQQISFPGFMTYCVLVRDLLRL